MTENKSLDVTKLNDDNLKMYYELLLSELDREDLSDKLRKEYSALGLEAFVEINNRQK